MPSRGRVDGGPIGFAFRGGVAPPHPPPQVSGARESEQEDGAEIEIESERAVYAGLQPVPQSRGEPLIPFRRMPDDNQQTRAAVSRRIGERERKRTHESPSERRSGHDQGSEHERKPERAAEAGEQGAGEQRAEPRRNFRNLNQGG